MSKYDIQGKVLLRDTMKAKQQPKKTNKKVVKYTLDELRRRRSSKPGLRLASELTRTNLKRGIRPTIGPKFVEYGRAVGDPFNMGGVHIPDMVTQPSGLVESISNFRQGFPAVAGTSTSHSGGMVIYPYPWYSYLVETSAGTGTLTDLANAAGTTSYAGQVPNAAAISPNMSHIRLVSAGIRFTFEGTELNRSGRFLAALLPIQDMDNVVPTTGTQLSCLGPLVGTTTITATQIINSAEKYTEGRVTDGTFEAHWLPRGPPHYQAFSKNAATVITSATAPFIADSTQGLSDYTPGIVVSTPGYPGQANAWNSGGSDFGSETGQYALVVIFEGDTTASAVATSNTYAVSMVWRWEVIPRDPTAVAYQLTPSGCDLEELSHSLNMLEMSPIGRAPITASSASKNF